MKRFLMITLLLVFLVMPDQCLAKMVPVQMHDEFSLQEVLERYNQYIRNNVNDDIAYKYFVSESPLMMGRDVVLPNTITFHTAGIQDVSIYAHINNDGKVVAISIYSPISIDKMLHAKYAYRFLAAIDTRNQNEKGILEKCALAVSTGTTQFYYSETAKRCYAITHERTEDGYLTSLVASAEDNKD